VKETRERPFYDEPYIRMDGWIGGVRGCSAKVSVRVIRTDEERIIAETVCRVLGLG
jgi:hypothetical protein